MTDRPSNAFASFGGKKARAHLKKEREKRAVEKNTWLAKIVLLITWESGRSAAATFFSSRTKKMETHLFFKTHLFRIVLRVARFVLVKNTKTGKNIPNYHKIYQMLIKHPNMKMLGCFINIARPSKIYPNCYFWSENVPSGNPDRSALGGHA
jgi:hypothetical protein